MGRRKSGGGQAVLFEKDDQRELPEGGTVGKMVSAAVHEVESTNVRAYAYDLDNLTLLVWYKGGGAYAYGGVDEELFGRLQACVELGGSVGRFINADVKTGHHFVKIDPVWIAALKEPQRLEE